MAARKPLVLGDDGLPQQLQSADSLAGVAAGGAGWSLAASWTYGGTAVASVDFTGLSGNEFLVVIQQVPTSGTSGMFCRASTDNGATFFATNGNYVQGSNAGSTSTVSHFGNLINASGGTALTGFWHIMNAKMAVKTSFVSPNGVPVLFVADAANPINALRVLGNAGNLTGGSIFIYSR